MTDFAAQCRTLLARRFNLDAAQLRDERLLLRLEGIDLYVEFHPPADSVAVYSALEQPIAEVLGELSAFELHTLLQQLLKTNNDLFERTLLRLYLDDDDRLGVAMDCSFLNCPDADHFGAGLQELVEYRQALQEVLN